MQTKCETMSHDYDSGWKTSRDKFFFLFWKKGAKATHKEEKRLIRLTPIRKHNKIFMNIWSNEVRRV